MPESASESIHISVAAPVFNEEENLPALVREIADALQPLGKPWEIVLTNDDSDDDSPAVLRTLMVEYPQLRVLSLAKRSGQTAALDAALRACRGQYIATLDADLQNDPADLPALVEKMRETGADMVQGDRSHARADNWMRKQTSRVGRFFRRALLGDTIRDTGCSLRVMRTELALRLPLEFKGMHRFIPVTARHLGYTVVETPVNHRERTAGETKYGSAGITKRAIPGLVDCFAVRYMRARRRPVASEELTP